VLVGTLRAVHVIAGLDPVYGGPSYSVPRLCEALAAAGAETTLVSVALRAEDQRDVCSNGYRDRRFAWDYARIPILQDLRISRGLSSALREAALSADVIHNHGLWLAPNVRAGQAAARRLTPLVISPRGMLAPAALAFSPAKKRVFWKLVQGPAMRSVACLHVTSEQEYEEIRKFGLNHPVAIIPNGIDVPELPSQPPAPPTAERIVLSLGRIHPKKGLVQLVHAWSRVEIKFPEWRLEIVGPSEAGHDEELRALAKALGLSRVSVEGPVYGDEKTGAYRNAELFVLSTLNENFGLTVAEALAVGVPAIVSKRAPWAGLEREGCGWWIDHGVEPLAVTLVHAMALPPEALKVMGNKGREWMVRDFSWDRVAHDILDVYSWLIRRVDLPPTIRVH
jgi:glycosyltransferase involved in cell wall biosynthesis